MLSHDDILYFERRAEEEIALAQAAATAHAVQAHYRLATLYLDRIYPAANDDAAEGSELSAPAAPTPRP